MSTEQLAREDVQVHVENIGSIDQIDSEVSPGVIALISRNATNRTSLLQAVIVALDSDTVSFKGDTDEGRVELTIGDTTNTHTLTRQNSTVITSGDPYLAGPTMADLFAFLLEANDGRRATARGEDLRDRIMRPIDTDMIRAALEAADRDVDETRTEKAELEEALDDVRETRQHLDDIRYDIDHPLREPHRPPRGTRRPRNPTGRSPRHACRRSFRA